MLLITLVTMWIVYPLYTVQLTVLSCNRFEEDTRELTHTEIVIDSHPTAPGLLGSNAENNVLLMSFGASRTGLKTVELSGYFQAFSQSWQFRDEYEVGKTTVRTFESDGSTVTLIVHITRARINCNANPGEMLWQNENRPCDLKR